ncbi:hypothetical protein ACH5RR_016648 [Cinchona calisaya]|uniref:Reverse transcriptase Ty1/copia-type domain-containing protein n=1 Tax=Cinchona calisaya TaxID=153742 RepID=A0ABD2ZWK7_9GENT
MQLPLRYLCTDDKRVCRLRCSLYGLKEASPKWFAKFSTAILQFGFKQSKPDNFLFIYQLGTSFAAILVYVDDVIVATNDSSKLETLKSYLASWLPIKYLGSLKYFLDLEVARCSKEIVFSQRKCTLDILQETGTLASKPVKFAMEQHHYLALDKSSSLEDYGSYRRLIGRWCVPVHT